MRSAHCRGGGFFARRHCGGVACCGRDGGGGRGGGSGGGHRCGIVGRCGIDGRRGIICRCVGVCSTGACTGVTISFHKANDNDI